ncbi:MAG: hypothetical protein FWH21_06280 [Kiritimatiellaeota bacterium]|nr:hypothetical protein [Kiritimatiellota bacterium]
MKTVLVAVIGVILVGAAYVFPSQFARQGKLENRRNELMQAIEQKKRATETLRRNQEHLETNAEFAEKVARQRRFIFKNELLFHKEVPEQ